MGLPSVGGLLSSLLASPDPKPTEKANLSGLALSWQDASGNTVEARFDTVSTQTYEATMQITDHPVEMGANVVDHAREQPDTITIEGFVSNKPLASNPGMKDVLSVKPATLDIHKKDPQLSLMGLTSAVSSAIGSLIGPPEPKVTAEQADFMPNRVQDMTERLDAARLARALITVNTTEYGISDMLMTRRAVARSLADGTGATFHVELRKIRLVKAQLVDAPTPAEGRGQAPTDTGKQTTKPAADSKKATVQQKKSFLEFGKEWVVGLMTK